MCELKQRIEKKIEELERINATGIMTEYTNYGINLLKEVLEDECNGRTR